MRPNSDSSLAPPPRSAQLREASEERRLRVQARSTRVWARLVIGWPFMRTTSTPAGAAVVRLTRLRLPLVEPGRQNCVCAG